MAFPNAERGHGLLRAAGNDVLERWPVSRRVNSSRRQRMTRASSSAWKCSKRYRHNDVVLRAFDLLELDGDDLRRAPIEERKATLAKLLRRPVDGIAFNEHYSGDGAIVFKNACAPGCEGIVSKRLGSPYRSGRAVSWIKVKNPAAPAVTREAEEEWN